MKSFDWYSILTYWKILYIIQRNYVKLWTLFKLKKITSITSKYYYHSDVLRSQTSCICKQRVFVFGQPRTQDILRPRRLVDNMTPRISVCFDMIIIVAFVSLILFTLLKHLTHRRLVRVKHSLGPLIPGKINLDLNKLRLIYIANIRING